MINIVLTAFISFVSTNIDDIFVLMLFFSQINNDIKNQHIVIGQYLGIGALITLSIIGALGVSVIPHDYVGLLGLAPIYLGIKSYIDNKKESKAEENPIQHESQNDENNKIIETTQNIISFIKNLINPNIVKVFSVTFANGADNIGVYVPLFTNMSLNEILITIIIFIILIGFWCFIGLKLSEHHFIQKNIEMYSHIFVPIIFIGLGIFILIKSGTASFIYMKVF